MPRPLPSLILLAFEGAGASALSCKVQSGLSSLESRLHMHSGSAATRTSIQLTSLWQQIWHIHCQCQRRLDTDVSMKVWGLNTRVCKRHAAITTCGLPGLDHNTEQQGSPQMYWDGLHSQHAQKWSQRSKSRYKSLSVLKDTSC